MIILRVWSIRLTGNPALKDLPYCACGVTGKRTKPQDLQILRSEETTSVPEHLINFKFLILNSQFLINRMFSAIYEGVLLGIFLAFSIGPSFFALVNTGISHGFKSGAAVAFGILFSDLFFVAATVSLIHFGMANLISNPKHQAFMGIIGGIVLIVYGVIHFVQKDAKHQADTELEIKSPKTYALVVKGFLLNLFNPFVWIFWMTTSTAISSRYEFHIIRVIVFFMAVLSITIGTDLLKTFVGHKIKNWLNAKILLRIRHVSGGLLIDFGLYLIYKVFFLHN